MASLRSFPMSDSSNASQLAKAKHIRWQECCWDNLFKENKVMAQKQMLNGCETEEWSETI